jgi:hypothetical protein
LRLKETIITFLSCGPGLARFRRILGLEDESPSPAQTRFWFAVSMLYALACASLALRQAFAQQYVLADDVRQHVFWMFRFIDPKFFPNDPIADYFQSIAPPGFAALYRFFAGCGINPLLASKLIPFGLGLLTAGYLFGAALRILRHPATAALATILLCQALWLSSDLCSATPRAFFYPFFCAFLYYQCSNHRIAVLVTLFLLAVFFPPGALVSLGIVALNLMHWENGWPILSRETQAYLYLVGAVVVTVLALIPYLHSAQKFGPVVSYSEARQMSEFAPGGRVPFFYPDLWNYWMHGAGGLHFQSRPSWLFAAFLWPVFAPLKRAFPMFDRMPAGARRLVQIAISALILFAISHTLLFRLYLPSRYTQHTARVLFAIAAATIIVVLADSLLRWSEMRAKQSRSLTAFGMSTLAVLLLLWIVCYPLCLSEFPQVSYITGKATELYGFFAAQPQTIRIASIADEANNLPVFCRRSIIFGVETAVPFHPGYYLPLRQRGLSIARAQYSPDLAVVQQCIRDQQIDFWLLDRGAFTAEHLRYNRVLRQLKIDINLPAGLAPFLQRPPSRCVVFADPRFIVVDARAVLALRKG